MPAGRWNSDAHAVRNPLALRRVVLCACLCADAACERVARSAADSGGVSARDTLLHTGADTLTPGTVSPRSVQWDARQLVADLEGRGLQVRRTAALVRQPFLGVPGVTLAVTDTSRSGADAELQAYFYGDAVSATRDIAQLDTVRVAPPTMQITWRLPPRLITDNNLVVLLLTRDETLASRITRLLRRSDLPLPTRD